MKKGLKNLLLAGALSASLFNTNPAIAEKKPKFDLKINYSMEIPSPNNPEYKLSTSSFSCDTNSVYSLSLSNGAPGITQSEKKQLESLLSAIKDKVKDINSYKNLISQANLSENQKIILLASISGLLYKNYYSLENNYVCRHIAPDIEELGEAMGMNIDSVTGKTSGGHAWDIFKTENGTGIIDAYTGGPGIILLSNSKNIEKLLDAYQRSIGYVAYQHSFFDKDKFRYRLITKDGRKFLDFVGYDESTQSSKDVLFKNIEADNSNSVGITLEGIDNFYPIVKINALGFFVKVGAFKDTFLSQIGYDNNFSISNVDIHPNVSILSGDLCERKKRNDISGFSGDLTIKVNNEQGLNSYLRTAGNIFVKKDSTLFNDFLTEFGNSYKIPIQNFSLEPYCIVQLGVLGDLLKEGNYSFNLRELKTGILFGIDMNDTKLSIDPYYILKGCEQGAGTEIKLGNKNFGLNFEGSLTRSSYDFCPNKYNIDAGLYLNLENLLFNVKYSDNITDYDGEIENNHSFSAQAEFKY
jgi:hypothetical protein